MALGAIVLALGFAAASAAAATPRSSSFDAAWRFALVNPEAATDPTGAYENAFQPGYDDSTWRRVRLPHDWSIELDADPGRHHRRRRLAPGRPRLVPQDVHAAARAARQAHLARVRWRLYGFRRVLQRPPGRRASIRLHRLQRRPDGARAHRRAHAERRGGEGAQPGAEQPLVLGERHLPPCPPRGHEPDPRGAPRRVRDHSRPRAPLRPRLRGRARADRRGRRAADGEGDLDGARRPGAPRRQVEHDVAGRDDRGQRRARRPPAAVVDRPSAPLHPRHAGQGRRARRRPHGDDVRHALVPVRPGRRLLAQRPAPEALRGRPAPRPGRARRGGQLQRRPTADADHEEHGRQRPAHVAQPAVARDDRRLRAARDPDDGRGVRHVAHTEARVRLRALLRRLERLRRHGDGQRRQELAVGRHVVDRQRDPGLDQGPGRAHGQAADRRRALHRHDAAGRDGLRQVPQRARRRLPAGPDPAHARRHRPQLQHRRLGRRPAREVSGQVLLRVRELLGDIGSWRLPGP